MSGQHLVGSPPQASTTAAAAPVTPGVSAGTAESPPVQGAALPEGTLPALAAIVAPKGAPVAPTRERKRESQLLDRLVRPVAKGVLLSVAGPALHLSIIRHMAGLQEQLGESLAGRLNSSGQFLAAAGILFGLKLMYQTLERADQLLPRGVDSSVPSGRALLRRSAVGLVGAGFVSEYFLTLRDITSPGANHEVLRWAPTMALVVGSVLTARALFLGMRTSHSPRSSSTGAD